MTVDNKAINKFKSFLIQKGLRVTNQRLSIFEAAYGSSDFFTAEDLLVNSKKLDDSVSRATVYRALPLLIESNLIRSVDVGKDYKFYMPVDNVKSQKAQIVCLDCDKIFEIDAPFMEWYGKSVAQKHGLIVEDQRLQVSARCNSIGKSCVLNHK